ncbi:MAG: MgtC/SapB family protein [Ferruginibacter sp.]|nr:MgtC/SapB family protein [Ferruginibacter sp.]
MNIELYLEEIGQVICAFIIGGVIGMEREFRSKAAGFRTMILICVGSCLYTIISKDIGIGIGSTDRIASNIVTGIGFIGAGVIFKEGNTVNGLTTAALIWTTAALGMAIGYHNYPLAVVVSIMVVIILFVLEPIQRFVIKFHKVQDYKIKTLQAGIDFKIELENFFKLHDITFSCIKTMKENMDAVYVYRISSKDRNYNIVNNFLLKHTEVKGFEV